MSIVLGIASGALQIGKKIFGKIKERRQEKANKAAARAQFANDKINSILGNLSDEQKLSSSGNAVASMKAMFSSTPSFTLPTDYKEVRAKTAGTGGMGGMNPMVLIGVSLIAILFLFKKR